MLIDNKRHILKTITWRIIATSTTILLVWLFTGSIEIGLGLGVLEIIIKTFLYYFHERFWYKFIRFKK